MAFVKIELVYPSTLAALLDSIASERFTSRESVLTGLIVEEHRRLFPAAYRNKVPEE
jgi:hypothetical protein